MSKPAAAQAIINELNRLDADLFSARISLERIVNRVVTLRDQLINEEDDASVSQDPPG